MQAPNKCPMCGAQDEWHLIDTAKKGFNAKHAVIGGVLLGGVGLAAGLSGKRKSIYQCGKCGFSHEYDGDIAEKDKFVEFIVDFVSTTSFVTIYLILFFSVNTV